MSADDGKIHDLGKANIHDLGKTSNEPFLEQLRKALVDTEAEDRKITGYVLIVTRTNSALKIWWKGDELPMLGALKYAEHSISRVWDDEAD